MNGCTFSFTKAIVCFNGESEHVAATSSPSVFNLVIVVFCDINCCCWLFFAIVSHDNFVVDDGKATPCEWCAPVEGKNEGVIVKMLHI